MSNHISWETTVVFNINGWKTFFKISYPYYYESRAKYCKNDPAKKTSFVHMCCASWYHLYNSKNVKNPQGGMLLLVKLQPEVCNFTRSNAPLWIFFTFLNWTWYLIAQRISYMLVKFTMFSWLAKPILMLLIDNFYYIKNQILQ